MCRQLLVHSVGPSGDRDLQPSLGRSLIRTQQGVRKSNGRISSWLQARWLSVARTGATTTTADTAGAMAGTRVAAATGATTTTAGTATAGTAGNTRVGVASLPV